VQGGVEGVGEEGEEEVGFDAVGFLVPDGAQGEVAFEGAEGLFDVFELHVVVPEFFGRVGVGGQVGA